MQSRDGIVVGRPGIFNGWPAAYGQPPAPPSIAGVETTVVVRAIHTMDGGGAGLAVVITNRQVYAFNGSSWTNVTPTYSVGTITATNGSPNITGAGGTLWNDNFIGDAYIRIDGADYLASITGNTTATLVPNFAGATGAGKTYVMTRHFHNPLNVALGDVAGFDLGVWSVIYNSDLYVAGRIAAANNGVLKVENVFGSPVSSYLTSTASLSPGLDTVSLATIVGLAVLQDGRVVISTIDNVVYYSSHLNTAVWTVAPGGETPLAEVDNRLRAQGRIGSTLTFHHATGIVFGDPTGLADPPLRFQASAADMGCVAPKTLRAWEGGEAFLAVDGDMKSFDGNRVVSMGGGEMRARTNALAFGVSHYDRYHGQVLTARGEYVLARTGSGLGTKLWTYSGGSWWPGETSMDVGTFSSDAEGVGDNFEGVQGG
jgi:hypothetical protein